MNPILHFYLDGPDNKNRYLKDILNWDDSKLEYTHDYIQWLFPLNERSHFNLEAPTLDNETILIWRESSALKEKLLESVKVYLKFLQNNPTIWITYSNHNHLRITRMLKCMKLLGLNKEAKKVYKRLIHIHYKTNVINSDTIKFWKDSVD